ncbi:hypothetical protein EEW87_006795 [Janibacter melonis]|uniref:DUF3367 domain-containing protein n=1 Tax=Janibacter melonis TaxID=262209 RepID=A0A5P8FMU5_9MICO|nr:hypothetical protein [Janibacter melonis]QFQ30082.1 hypothetical protein EEW87_006795 [Janibacter melonis]
MSTLRGARLGALVGLVLGVLALGPALAPGYTLHYDMVFTPQLPLSARTLGVDGSVPRAVPSDLVVALVSTLVPGWVVQKVVLLGSFVVAGAGAGRLATTRPGSVAAAALMTWNPWVAERLAIGHWVYVAGLALLPWVLGGAVAHVRARADGPARERWALPVLLVLAGLGGSTTNLLAAIVAAVAVVAAGTGRRDRARGLAVVAVVSLVVSAAWWWPFLTAAPWSADPSGVEAFATTADTPFGLLGSALLGGGIWHEPSWPVERTGVLVSGVALLLTLAVLVAALARRSWWADPRRRSAALVGLLALVLAVVPATGPGAALTTALVEHVPGAGLLRDSQKLLAPAVLLLAVAAGAVVDGLVRARAGVVLVVAAVVWPVATLPGLALGSAGAWGSVDYPAAYVSAAAAVDDAPGQGAVLVLPWSTYRAYPWDAGRVVLDPWDRLVRRDVVRSDDLPVSGRRVVGEDPRAAEVGELLRGDAPAAEQRERLRALGVRYVLLDASQPGDPTTSTDLGGAVVVREGGLTLTDLGPTSVAPRRDAPVGLVLAGLGSLVVLVGAARAHRRAPARRRADDATRG